MIFKLGNTVAQTIINYYDYVVSENGLMTSDEYYLLQEYAAQASWKIDTFTKGWLTKASEKQINLADKKAWAYIFPDDSMIVINNNCQNLFIINE